MGGYDDSAFGALRGRIGRVAVDPHIAVLVPVLARPHRAAPLVEGIRASASVPTEVVFLCSPGDAYEIDECAVLAAIYENVRTIVVDWAPGRGDYARKINRGVSATTALHVFTGADDLTFQRGWDTAALQHPHHGVVGTDDRCNPRTRGARRHSTHSLVARWYIEEWGTIDEPGKLLHESYWHNFCDDECVGTAVARRQYAASRAVVKHNHPLHDSGVPMDDTYSLGLAHFDDDRSTFHKRSPLWRPRAVHRQTRRPR